MSRILRLLAVSVAGVAASGLVLAKLPPPTEEQKAKAQQDAERSKAQVEHEKAALTRVQDQVVARYRQDELKKGRQPPPPTPTAQTTAEKDIPKAVREVPGKAGPHGGTTPSAESHSGGAEPVSAPVR